MDGKKYDETNPTVLVIRQKKYSIDENSRCPEQLEAEAYNQKQVQGAKTEWTKKTIFKGAQIRLLNKRGQMAISFLDQLKLQKTNSSDH